MLTDVQPEIIDTGGKLPPFWDHNVLFIANLLALFFGNEEETRLLAREVRGAETYGGRLVPILNLLYRADGNQLLLEREPDPALGKYFRRDLKLTLPATGILDHADYVRLGHLLKSGDGPVADELLKRLPANGVKALDGYVTDEVLVRIAERLGLPTVASPEGSHRGNNKLLLHEALVKAGLPTFTTRLAARRNDVPGCLAKLAGQGYQHAAVKSQLGASGIGIVRVPTDAYGKQLEGVTDLMFYEGPCLVQGWLDRGCRGVERVTSPSVQLFLDAGRVHLYDVTDQILASDSVHQGNESPPDSFVGTPGLREELFAQAAVAGRWLHTQGYRGTASVDFLVTWRPDEGFVVYVCEINARITGATYPAVLARHFFPEGAWLMRNVKLSAHLSGGAVLDRLAGGNSLFRLGRTAGVLPINFNTDKEGLVHKGQFLCLAKSVAECHEWLREAERDLGIPWHYVRD